MSALHPAHTVESQYVWWYVTMVLAASACGCAGSRPVWNDRPARVLREILLTDEHADLDVATVRIPAEEKDELDRIWQLCDEQALSVECRRTLQENGFRAGVMGLVLPERLRQELSANNASGLLPLPQSPVDSATDVPLRFQRLRVRWGQRHEIVGSGIRPESTCFFRHANGLSGKTFNQAQAMIATTARPGSDGAIVLELVPEIHHGDLKQRYVAGEGTFRLSASRERFTPPGMRIEVPLSPGESLLIGSQGPPGSFGRSFLDDQSHSKLMIIRLSGTQHEPLYKEPATDSVWQSPDASPRSPEPTRGGTELPIFSAEGGI